MLHEEWLESPTEFPQKELGAEVPSQTLLLTLQLQGAPALILKCLIYHIQCGAAEEIGSWGIFGSSPLS